MAGPDSPPPAAAQPGPARSGVDGHAQHRVDQGDRLGPGLGGRRGDRGAGRSRWGSAWPTRGRPQASDAAATRRRPAVAGAAGRTCAAAVLRFGHDRLTSTATTAGGASASSAAAAGVVLDGAAPDAGHHGGAGGQQRRAARRSSQARHARALAGRRELSMPPCGLVHPGRRVAGPRLGGQRLDHHRAQRGRGRRSGASSAPWPAVPDAVITGFGSSTDPTRVVRSTTGAPARRRRRQRRPTLTAGSCCTPAVVLLQAAHRQRVAGPVGHAGGRGPGRPPPSSGSGTRWPLAARADVGAVGPGPAAPRGVDDQLHLARLAISSTGVGAGVGSAQLGHHRRPPARRVGLEVGRRCPRWRRWRSPARRTGGPPRTPGGLVPVGQREEHRAARSGSAVAGRHLALGEGQPEGAGRCP